MEIHPYSRKSLSFLFLLLCVSTVVLGCVLHSKDPLVIYLTTKEEKASQIWQLNGNESVSMLHEVTKSLERPISVVFPPEEAEKLRMYLNVPSLPSLFPEPYIQDLQLSPSKEALVWIEGDVYCVNGAVGCFGVYRLMVSDLSTQETRVLLQLPQHAGEHDLKYYFPSQPVWSPNNRYIAMIGGFWGMQMETSFMLIEVATGEITKVVSPFDSGGPLSWSPDSTSVAWVLSGWRSRSNGGSIRIYYLSTATAKDIHLDGLWVWGWGLDWSPQENHVVFSGANQGPNTADGKEIQLYLLDPDTSQVHLIPVAVDGVLENPRWSPDGQLLAADLRPTTTELYTSLVVIEPNTGEIVTQLAVERAGRVWRWGADSKNILVHLNENTYRSEQELGIFNVEEGTLRVLPLPEELAAKQIRDLSW